MGSIQSILPGLLQMLGQQGGIANGSGSASIQSAPPGVRPPMFSPTMSQASGQAPQTSGGPVGGGNDLSAMLSGFLGQVTQPSPMSMGQSALKAVQGGGQFTPGQSIVQPGFGASPTIPQSIDASAKYQIPAQASAQAPTANIKPPAFTPRMSQPAPTSASTQPSQAAPKAYTPTEEDKKRVAMQIALNNQMNQGRRSSSMFPSTSHPAQPSAGSGSSNMFQRPQLVRNTPTNPYISQAMNQLSRPAAPSNPTTTMQKPGAQKR